MAGRERAVHGEGFQDGLHRLRPVLYDQHGRGEEEIRYLRRSVIVSLSISSELGKLWVKSSTPHLVMSTRCVTVCDRAHLSAFVSVFPGYERALVPFAQSRQVSGLVLT